MSPNAAENSGGAARLPNNTNLLAEGLPRVGVADEGVARPQSLAMLRSICEETTLDGVGEGVEKASPARVVPKVQ